MNDITDQECTADRIRSFHSRMIKTPKDKRTVSWLKANLEAIEALWAEFHERHRLISRKVAELKENSYFTDDVYGSIQNEYLQVKSNILTALQPGRNQSSVQADKDNASVLYEAPSHRSPLEPMKLPKFSGKKLEWESFKGMFVSLVHDVPSIPPILKLQYLLGSLTGDAAHRMRNTKVSAENYDTAWGKMLRRYDNKRVLIAAHMDNMISCPPANKKSIDEINRILDVIIESRSALENLLCPVGQWDAWFVHLAVYKLDPATREEWGKTLGQTADLPTFEQLTTFIESAVGAMETASSNATQVKKAPPSAGSKESTNSAHTPARAHVAAREPTSKKKGSQSCIACSEHHFVTSCDRYKAMSPAQRRALLQKGNHCENCMRKNHSTSDCRATGRCFVCNGKHHTPLHEDREQDRRNDGVPNPESAIATTSSATPSDCKNDQPINKKINTTSVQQQVLLATAIVEFENEHGDSVRVRALLDQGAEFSFITERVVQCLSLSKVEVNIPVLGVGGVSPGIAKTLVSVILRSPLNPDFSMRMEALTLKKLTPMLPSADVQHITWDHVEGLQLADPNYGIPARIDCIIGAEVYGRLLTGNIRHGKEGEPTAQETVFGWVLSGFTSEKQQPSSFSSVARTFHAHIDASLHDALRKFWEIEEIRKPNIRSPEDEFTQEHFKKTYKRDSTGRFVLRMPLLKDPPDLGDSKSIAIARWLQVESKLKRDPELSKLYREFMAEYLHLGHMEPVVDGDTDAQRIFYIPHHGVVKQSGAERKIRVVFNASQKASKGVSLNDLLPAGPKLQEDLWIIVTRWRFFSIVFMADIVKMFRQLRMDRQDADLLRIVWREFPDGELLVFRLMTVTYGTTPAPYQAIESLLQLSRLYMEKYPQAAKLIRRNKYVDDFLAGADTIEEAKALQEELINLLSEARIPLGKWASNEPSLLTTVQSDFSIPLDIKLDECVSTLGLSWLPKIDSFKFKVDKIKIPGNCTKRTILDEIARLFDPLGWLAPIVVRAKVLMQHLWILGSGWDEPVPEDMRLAWIQFVGDLQDLENVRIPRWFGTTAQSRLQIHGFSDASERAYAAAIYIVSGAESNWTANLIIAKTKIAPIKTLSVPRLELCGAQLLAKLTREVLDAMDDHEFDIYCWTDARVVLGWLATHPSRWSTFVATRTSSILTLLPGIPWLHVKGQENPADLATRGLTPAELQDSTLWWHGPAWLTNGILPSPLNDDATEQELPERRQTTKTIFVTQDVPEEFIDRFSSYPRLLRVVCYCLRFIDIARRAQVPNRNSWISTWELLRSRTLILKVTQGRWFSDELNELQQGRPVHRNSPLRPLNPFIHQDGLIRIGGRLANAALPFHEKHPVVLQKYSLLTRLVIKHAHEQTLHGGPQLTQSYLLRSFWVIRGKSIIYSVIKGCVRCARFTARPQSQQMGALPAARVTPLQTFQRTGVDYAGLLHIRMSPGRGNKSYKGYLCIFVCLVTKAVHIEIVSDYSSAAFIAAFKRFVSRRGRCTELFSDNGTNFHGAKGELQRLFQQASMKKEVAEYVENDGTSWSFIPPSSPHWGGLWEAAVKSAKYHLCRVIGDSTLTYEELSTLTAQVEACMNSRPLCFIGADSQDFTPLTPGHFLTGLNRMVTQYVRLVWAQGGFRSQP